MNSHEITKHLDALAGEGMPASIDLWPRVQARVGAATKRRTATRRQTIGRFAAAVIVLALAFAAVVPNGTHAAAGATNGVLSLFGFEPIAISSSGPLCVNGDDRADPIYTPAAPGDFTVTTATGEPLPPGATAAMQISCPAGYELTFTEGAGAVGEVLSFFGFAAVTSSSVMPSCVNDSGRVEPIQTPPAPETFTNGTALMPAGATPAMQISCPVGYELTFAEK